MEKLLDLYGLLAVLLRGGALVCQSLTLGGVVFLWLVMGRKQAEEASHPALRAARRLLFASATGLALIQGASVALSTAVLVGTTGISLGEAMGAEFVLAGALVTAGALCIAAAGILRVRAAWLAVPGAAVLAGAVLASHGAARMETRAVLVFLTAAHEAATAAWIGGLAYLILMLGRLEKARALNVTRRFSRLALGSVGVLVAAGLAMALVYVGTPSALYGTAYGAMMTTKGSLLVLLVGLGALNFFVLRQADTAAAGGLMRVRRLIEAELGIGLTVILAAASLTSQPPSVDQPERVTASEIAARNAPRWPRLHSPKRSELRSFQALARGDASARQLESYLPGGEPRPRSPVSLAWSEYNHNWSGMVVLCIGLLAVVASQTKARWAQSWPLGFLGLAVFLFLRSDPSKWPLGPIGFWQSFAIAEVTQHRVFVLLIVALAVFEWGVRTGRIVSERAAMAFPLVSAVGGAILLTHSHSLTNVKEELLIELTHIPIAVLGVVAGWSRWLELRLPDAREKKIAARIWPWCLVAVGLLLILYRES